MTLTRRCLAEGFATFVLVIGCAGSVAADWAGGYGSFLSLSIAAGLVVMAMIYTVGDVSGAHMNPAVTVAFALSGRFPWREVPGYVGAQVIGAIAAGLMLKALFPEQANLGQHLPEAAAYRVLLMEVVITFILMYVILSVATGAKEKGIMAGIAIGGAVAVGMLVGGPVSGGSMNPARTLGPAIATGTLWPLWMYWTAPFLGAALAVPVCRLTCGKDGCCEPIELKKGDKGDKDGCS